MTPILGIMASQISGHLSTTSYESIATTTVGSGGTTYVEFTSIPATYKHLQIRYLARDDNSGVDGTNVITINGDTGTNYWSAHFLYGNGTSLVAGSGANVAFINQYRHAGNGAASNVFGGGTIDILDYTSTNKNKTLRYLAGFDNNGSGQLFFGSALWYPSTIAAITSIKLTPSNGTPKYLEYSSFALYGVK